MGKKLFIAEKPSVARDYAKALGEQTVNKKNYEEGDNIIITWCVGHLVALSYPEAYGEQYRQWKLETIPFIPDNFIYELKEDTKAQFDVVCRLLNRDDVDTIYVCTDSGREGEYIYRLVEQEAQRIGGKVLNKDRRRVWINSFTEDEVRRGVREAKPISEYDALSDAAYLRAKEDYLMGINFSRAISLKYRYGMGDFLNEKKVTVAVGRVMTCVLGMIVRREREIRDFDKTPFYRVLGDCNMADSTVTLEWKAVEGSKYFESPLLYKENGFKKQENAQELIDSLGREGILSGIDKKTEKKKAPALYNLAELQNDCSRFFKISPDETLNIAQELYEKKLTTYPRTDARVLSTAVAKEIDKNIQGLTNINSVKEYAEKILNQGLFKGIEKVKRYTDDSKITDHFAIIPTGQGLSAMRSLSNNALFVYEVIVRRFLSIFYPEAVYEKIGLDVAVGNEYFFASQKVLKNPGYLEILEYSFKKKKDEAKENSDAKQNKNGDANGSDSDSDNADSADDIENSADFADIISKLKKGDTVSFKEYYLREGETKPPKRYNSGNMIIAMENAGKLIEDEELREQIKGAGIGTSATRAGILKKLVDNKYINLNKKTQIYTPTLLGEMIFEVVQVSVPSLLNAELTASWEKGLSGVAAGNITNEEYMNKLSAYVTDKTNRVKASNYQNQMMGVYRRIGEFYKK